MRTLVASGVAGEPQPASKAFKTRAGAANTAARQRAYSEKISDGLLWDVAPVVEGGWAVFCTEDGWTSNDEYLDNVECADCKETRVDLRRCDICDVRDCSVQSFSCDGGGYPDGLDLCDEHTPRHSGCPHCDPRMPWEE